MTRNVGRLDRLARALAALGMFAAATAAPLAPALRFGVLIPLGVYVGFTALAGTCLGYRMMGKSTCPARE